MKKSLFILLIGSFWAFSAFGQQFSLDDNPSAPAGFFPAPPYISAEDPYGMGLPPTVMGLIGPSPTLFMGFSDADILFNFPPIGVVIPGGMPPLGHAYIDAYSVDHGPWVPYFQQTTTVRFSIDRMTTGMPGTASLVEAAANQQPGDIYDSVAAFMHPGAYAGFGFGAPIPYAGILPGTGSGIAGGGLNVLVTNQTGFGLIPAVPATMPAPPIAPGTHDNIDAYDDKTGAPAVTPFFYSVPPAEAFVVMGGAVSPADLLISGPGPYPGFVFAGAGMMGLDSMGYGTDDINALTVWDVGRTPGGVDPGMDYALFSLSPGSASVAFLAPGPMWPGSPGDILFTDFTGTFFTYIHSTDLGLANLFDPMCINVDALEIY